MRITSNRSSRGVSLVEAMVALAVMAFGMLAVVGVQSTLRLNAEVAKQRTEATRIAQETVEARRGFTAIEGAGGYDESIVNAGPTAVTGLITNTTYSVQSEVVTYTDPPAKALRVTVRWTDRANTAQQVILASAIAAAAPALSGTLAVRPGTAPVGPVRRPMGRHPSIPVQARQLGGSSAFVPPFKPRMAILFNNVTGVVTGVCNFNYDASNDTITAEDIASCNNTITGQLLSGFVRFQRTTSGPELVAADVEDPLGPALNLRMHIDLTSSGHPSGTFCIDDADSTSVSSGTLLFATYFCVIYSNTSGLWSGITTIEPRSTFGDTWTISDDDGNGNGDSFRVCRYTSASSDAQTVPNTDHPRDYSDVGGNLTNQNFVVISSSKHCPTDVPANPASGDFVNSNTLQHQPAPS
jgi:Tfp pilus assembly protein PilV